MEKVFPHHGEKRKKKRSQSKRAEGRGERESRTIIQVQKISLFSREFLPSHFEREKKAGESGWHSNGKNVRLKFHHALRGWGSGEG